MKNLLKILGLFTILGTVICPAVSAGTLRGSVAEQPPAITVNCNQDTNQPPSYYADMDYDNLFVDCHIGTLPTSLHGRWIVLAYGSLLVSNAITDNHPNEPYYTINANLTQTNLAGVVVGDDPILINLINSFEQVEKFSTIGSFADGDNPHLQMHLQAGDDTGITIDSGQDRWSGPVTLTHISAVAIPQ